MEQAFTLSAYEGTTGRRTRLASEHVRWLSGTRWNVALTLNFDANVSRHRAVQAAQIYWHKLDCELLGSNAVQRHGQRLLRACFIEGEAGTRNWHYHAAVQLPNASVSSGDAANVCAAGNFGDLLVQRWEAMREAGRFSKAEPIYSSAGWLAYISKDVGWGECEMCTATTHVIGNRDTM